MAAVERPFALSAIAPVEHRNGRAIVDRGERRRRVVALHRDGESMRGIARRLAIGMGTVYRDLEAEGVRRGNPAPTPAPRNNVRALSHGVNSERMIAPVRAEHAAELARRYPWIDDGRRALQAQRLAQIDLAATWIDGKGGVVRDDEGRVFDVADRLANWLGGAERWYARAEEERREIRRSDVLDAVLAEAEVSDNGR